MLDINEPKGEGKLNLSADGSLVPSEVPTTKADIKTVQKKLADNGYLWIKTGQGSKPKEIDGAKGKNYYNAIKSFQHNNGLSVTGEIDTATAIKMNEGSNTIKTNPAPKDPLLAFISSGEGGYGAANNGDSSRGFSVYDSFYVDSKNKPLQELNIREILNLQTGNNNLTMAELKQHFKNNIASNNGAYIASTREMNNRTFFTVGAYQIIPATMMAAVKKMGLSGDEVFNPQLQDRIANNFLAGSKRGKLSSYIKNEKYKGQNVTLEEALKDAAKEWASIPTAKNKSYYPGQRAAHTAKEAKDILRNAQSKYIAKSLGLGI